MPAKNRLLALDKPIWIDVGERRDRRNAVAHHVAVRAPEKWDQREIIGRDELRNAVSVPMAQFADTRICGERRELPGKNGARLVRAPFGSRPTAQCLKRGEVVDATLRHGRPRQRRAGLLTDRGAQECRYRGRAEPRNADFGLPSFSSSAAFLAPAGFDVARHIAAGLLAQEIGHADQILGSDGGRHR